MVIQYGEFSRELTCENFYQHAAAVKFYDKAEKADPKVCSTLQHTATHCNTLQHTASHCHTLQHVATPTHPHIHHALQIRFYDTAERADLQVFCFPVIFFHTSFSVAFQTFHKISQKCTFWNLVTCDVCVCVCVCVMQSNVT